MDTGIAPGPAPGISAAAEFLHIPPDLHHQPLYTTGQGPYNNDDLELRYGTLCSIAGSTGCGKTLLGLHAITTHLLTHPTSSAAWIDTVGGFSARWLKGIVEGRIADARSRAVADGEGLGGEEDASSGIGEAEMQKMVDGVLDRVLVMRVFDWCGIVEAVGEVRSYIEEQYREGKTGLVSGDGDVENGNGNRKDVEVSMQSREQRMMIESSPLSPPPPSSQLVTPSPPLNKLPPTLVGGKSEIPDSDAETDDEGVVCSPSPPASSPASPPLPPHSQPHSSDENGLPTLPSYSNARGNTEIHLDSDKTTSPSSHTASLPVSTKQIDPAIGLLVIDTITFPIEIMINKASSSSSTSFSSAGAAASTAPGTEAIVQAKVAEVYALVERYFGEVGKWAGECGLGVLLLNTTTPHPSTLPSPSLGPFFQHILDISILLPSLPTPFTPLTTTTTANRGRSRGRGVRGGSRGRGRGEKGRGGEREKGEGREGREGREEREGQEETSKQLLIGYKILHDRGGEMGGRKGVVRVGI